MKKYIYADAIYESREISKEEALEIASDGVEIVNCSESKYLSDFENAVLELKNLSPEVTFEVVLEVEPETFNRIDDEYGVRRL